MATTETTTLGTPGAAPASDAPPESPWVTRYLTFAPWAVTLLLLTFVATNLTGGGSGPAADEQLRQDAAVWPQALRLWVLMLLLTMAAVWFIACFTGSPDRKLHHAFVFAYAFTFGAFALLLTPFVGAGDELAPVAGAPSNGRNAAVRPREGVLQLVRGCVRATDAQTDAVSAVTRCPDIKLPTLPRVEPGDTRANAPGAVGASASAKVDGRGAKSPAPPLVPATGTTADARPVAQEMDRQYLWLVSIGGVTARRYQPVFDGKSPLRPDANSRFEPRQFVEVQGGLTVPLFVVVLAYIGGAVSLSRRIPEYQRRAHKNYQPTESEPAMEAFQARESVVFQIMQLVSAPFLALTSWYIVGPTTLANAVGLAFITGFLSEHVLLMIRGMAEGIRPALTRTAQPPAAGNPQ